MSKYKYKIGDKISIIRIFTSEDVEKYSEITGDTNPIHLNEEYAAKSIFKKRVVHGIYTISLFSKIFGTIYPKQGGIYLTQNCRFLKPIFIGEKITAEVELIDINEKMIGEFNTICYNSKGEIVVQGEAKIKLP